MKLIVQMLATLTVIGIISGGLLAQIDNWAQPKIAGHAKKETEKAIFIVQPDANSYESVETAGFELYKVFDENKKSLGYAMPHNGNGFQGNVKIMIGVAGDMNSLIGLEILEQVETPGLGTKVCEPFFKDQFKGLACDPRIEWVKGAEPSKPNEIQAITGATISSKAVVAIINDGLNKLKSVKEGGAEL